MQKQAAGSFDPTPDQTRLMDRLKGLGYNVRGPGYDYTHGFPDAYWFDLPRDFPGETENVESPIRDEIFWSTVGRPGDQGLMSPEEWRLQHGTSYIDQPEYLNRYSEMADIYSRPVGASPSRFFNPKEPLGQKLNRMKETAQGMRNNAMHNDINYLRYLNDHRTNPKYYD